MKKCAGIVIRRLRLLYAAWKAPLPPETPTSFRFTFPGRRRRWNPRRIRFASINTTHLTQFALIVGLFWWSGFIECLDIIHPDGCIADIRDLKYPIQDFGLGLLRWTFSVIRALFR